MTTAAALPRCLRSGSSSLTRLALGVDPSWRLSMGQRGLHGGKSEHFPVAVVGGGPTGLTLSILLSQLGVRHLLVEQSSKLTDQPQAHFINHRTMEIFRNMGGLAAEVRRLSPPLDDWRSFVYCSAMLKEIFGTVDHFPCQQSSLRPDISPEPVTHLPQNRLLPLLLRRAESHPQTASIHFGSRVANVCDLGDRVALDVETPTAQSACGRRRYTCDYLVAADGANSRVRQRAGIRMEGEAAMQNLINIHFFSEDLAGKLRSDRRLGMLYFCFNPSVVAVIVAHSIEDGEFVAQIPFFPPLQSADYFMTPSVAKGIIQAAAGAEVEVTVKSVRPWTMSAQVAERFQAGRIFLAGDAAHRFPPAGGFGMNTGIQDAHNLAWKLAASLSGLSPPSLLGTFHEERRPVAVANTRLSISNFENALQVPRAIGLDPRAANVASSLLSPLKDLLPAGVPQMALEACLTVGRAASAAPSVPVVGGWAADALRRVFSEGRTLRLQFPAEDLGFVYNLANAAGTSQQRKPAEGGAREHRTAAPSAQRQGSTDDYEPSATPGARLPHCELHLLPPAVPYVTDSPDQFLHSRLLAAAAAGSKGQSGIADAGAIARLSTVDVVAACGAQSLLVVGDGHRVSEWFHALLEVRRLGYDLQLLQILDSLGSATSAVALPCHLGVAAAVDGSSSWAACRGVSANGALLVRPDGHVAWRWNAPPGGGDSATVVAEGLRLQLAEVYHR